MQTPLKSARVFLLNSPGCGSWPKASVLKDFCSIDGFSVTIDGLNFGWTLGQGSLALTGGLAPVGPFYITHLL